jgi:hypothetical protein
MPTVVHGDFSGAIPPEHAPAKAPDVYEDEEELEEEEPEEEDDDEEGAE